MIMDYENTLKYGTRLSLYSIKNLIKNGFIVGQK